MDSEMVEDLLPALYVERHRLEVVLRPNPDFRKLEEVRRVIALYEADAVRPAQGVPNSFPDLPSSAVPVDAGPGDDSGKAGHYDSLDEIDTVEVPSRPNAAGHDAPTNSPIQDEPPRRTRRTWKGQITQTEVICNGAEEYLREKGSRAKGPEGIVKLSDRGRLRESVVGGSGSENGKRACCPAPKSGTGRKKDGLTSLT
jgi:hypothetical protein